MCYEYNHSRHCYAFPNESLPDESASSELTPEQSETIEIRGVKEQEGPYLFSCSRFANSACNKQLRL
jgi:hypothetical protein